MQTDQIGRSLWVVALRGEHDLATADDVDAALTAVTAAGTTVIVDLTRTVFIDSSIIGVIYKHAVVDAEPVLVAASDGSPVRRVLELVQLGRHVRLFESREDAAHAADTGA